MELEGGFLISSLELRIQPSVSQVYAYKKRQVCSSEVKFVEPGVALDSEGKWRLIVQSPNKMEQTVAMDTCTNPDSPCPGVSECGKKSRCVQRYNYQLLMAIPLGEQHQEDCPSLRAFRLPAGCVCHAETSQPREKDSNF